MKINLVDLKSQYKTIENEIQSAINAVINKTNFIQGDELIQFENDFAVYCGTKYAAGVGSGTDALELSLRALNIGKGDEVIVPTFTFFSTASVVCYTGAKPVFCDVEEDTANIDVNKLEIYLKKSKKVKAIIPVHLFGQPCDMDKILKLAKKYKVKVIEDACQAHGSLYNSKIKGQVRAGSMGDTGCFSFYPAKNLGAYGDGGIIITNNKVLYDKLKMLRDCGRSAKYTHGILGYCKRLDTIQAAVLGVKLKKLDSWNEARRQVAKTYSSLLSGTGANPLKVRDFATPVYHMYVTRVKNRDNLQNYLAEKSIGTGVHYPIPLHLQPAFKFLGYKKGDFSVSEKLSKEVISLPIYPEITKEQIEEVVNEIKNFNNQAEQK